MESDNVEINWTSNNFFHINRKTVYYTNDEIENYRMVIEPWLSAVFQSEHLSLFLGNGLSIAISTLGNCTPAKLNRLEFKTHSDKIKNWSEIRSTDMSRGEPNFEDDIRSALELLKGLMILNHSDDAKQLCDEINNHLKEIIDTISSNELELSIDRKETLTAFNYLKSFLTSFACRTATRDRLNIFTINYDRIIEYACDLAGIIILDRFEGKIKPFLRTTKIELDYHYNPPGIRGEPRYVEGVIRYTKLHGSIDWKFTDGLIFRDPIAFGNPNFNITDPKNQVVIYPNSAKGIEISFYPYSELFRDFSSAICRPNTSIVIYGYSFGDSHINKILEDMLAIPSTHIVIIAFDDYSGRIRKFVERNNLTQMTILIGNHFGNLQTLVDNYLPKSAIDRISEVKHRIIEKRGSDFLNRSEKMDNEDE